MYLCTVVQKSQESGYEYYVIWSSVYLFACSILLDMTHLVRTLRSIYLFALVVTYSIQNS